MKPKAYHGKYTDAHQPNPWAPGTYSKAMADGGKAGTSSSSTGKYAPMAYIPKVGPPKPTPAAGTYAKSGAEAKGLKGAVAPAAPAGKKGDYATHMKGAPFKGKY